MPIQRFIQKPPPPRPDWIRVKAPVSKDYQKTHALIRDHKLNTVCEEASCPNIGECWAKKHATVMILGSTCTRACTFLQCVHRTPRSFGSPRARKSCPSHGQIGLKSCGCHLR